VCIYIYIYIIYIYAIFYTLVMTYDIFLAYVSLLRGLVFASLHAFGLGQRHFATWLLFTLDCLADGCMHAYIFIHLPSVKSTDVGVGCVYPKPTMPGAPSLPLPPCLMHHRYREEMSRASCMNEVQVCLGSLS